MMEDEEEEFDFEYEDEDGDEEPDVDLENKYYNAKGNLFSDWESIIYLRIHGSVPLQFKYLALPISSLLSINPSTRTYPSQAMFHNI